MDTDDLGRITGRQIDRTGLSNPSAIAEAIAAALPRTTSIEDVMQHGVPPMGPPQWSLLNATPVPQPTHGGYSGHVLPGVAFLALGFWWLMGTVRAYARARVSPQRRPFRPRAWYPVFFQEENEGTPKNRFRLPLEPCLILALCTLGINGELWLGHESFRTLHREDGYLFQMHLAEWQHVVREGESLFFCVFKVLIFSFLSRESERRASKRAREAPRKERKRESASAAGAKKKTKNEKKNQRFPSISPLLLLSLPFFSLSPSSSLSPLLLLSLSLLFPIPQVMYLAFCFSALVSLACHLTSSPSSSSPSSSSSPFSSPSASASSSSPAPLLPARAPLFGLAGAFALEFALFAFHLEGTALDVRAHKLLVVAIGCCAALSALEALSPSQPSPFAVELAAAKSFVTWLQGCWFVALAEILFAGRRSMDPRYHGSVMFLPAVLGLLALGSGCLWVVVFVAGGVFFERRERRRLRCRQDD